MQKITENDVPQPVREFSRFDGNVLLGLDRLGLRGLSQRHLPEGGRGGVGRSAVSPWSRRGSAGIAGCRRRCAARVGAASSTCLFVIE